MATRDAGVSSPVVSQDRDSDVANILVNSEPVVDAIEGAPADSVVCVICGALCPTTTAPGIYCHPAELPCVAVLINDQGESIDQRYFIAQDGCIYATAVPTEQTVPVEPENVVTETQEPEEDHELPVLPDAPPVVFTRKRKQLPADAVVAEDGTLFIPTEPDPNIVAIEIGLQRVFEKYGVERLGGASGDLGWSSFSTYQRCPYLFRRTYIERVGRDGPASRSLEMGSAFHALAAVYYQRIIDPSYPITPQALYEGLLEAGCDGELLMEAWRIWSGYMLRYEHDYLTPLAVEHHVVDSVTRESARYDLIARIDQATELFPAGTVVVEHKTASRFDDATIDGWQNDGEVIGQIMLWNRCKLSKKFGKLVGVLVNIVGKQRSQQFHRTLVIAGRRQISQHAQDLQIWQGFRQLAMASGVYPRSRAGCLGRYGKCSQWDHCAERGD